MRGSIEVTWCPNPLRPVSDRETRSLLLTGRDTVNSLVRRLGLARTPLVVNFNGNDLARDAWMGQRVSCGDTLVLRQAARGAEVGTYAFASATMKAGATIATATAIAAVATFITNMVIAMAVGALLASLSKKSTGANSATANSPAAYGVEGGSNSARAYEPLLLVLGEHRIFPDYASRPFTEFVPDPSTLTQVFNNTVETALRTPPAFTFIPADEPVAGEEPDPPTASAPWVLIDTIMVEVPGGGGDGSGTSTSAPGTYIFGDGAARTYRNPGYIGGIGTPYTAPHSFVLSHGPESGMTLLTTWEEYERSLAEQVDANWRPFGALPIIVRYGYEVTYNTERLATIVNFGFGDLDISGVQLGSSDVSSYNAVQRHDSQVPAGQGDRTQLLGYTSANWPGTAYPGNVQLVDGGKLEQHDLVVNGGWIERQGSEGCRYLQVDIAGRLFLQAGGGTENLACTFEAQYQAVGSDAWQALPFSPFTLTNGSTTTVRQTFSCMLPVSADAVRVRRSTPDPTDSTQISEFECTRVKFFRNADGLYPAQKRMGLLIKATGQLNGRIERLSAFVRAKHWIWNSGAPWDGSMPGTSANWTWGNTVNPAWLFLYYARGGFLNATATPAHLGLAGWLDQPSVGNGSRLFGAGLTNDRIDYAAIVAWGQFCAGAQLECRMAIMTARSAGDVLDDIAASGRATKSWAPGKLSVVWEAPGQSVVAAFGMSNVIAGSFSVAYASDNTVDEYALNYTRSDGDYEADTVYATVPGVPLPVNQKTEQAVYSMSRSQAQRLANLLAAARHFHRRIIRWETNILGLTVQRGDIVHLAHDLTKWAYSGRLVDLVAVDGQIRTVTLSAEVENPTAGAAFYLWISKPNGVFMSVQCTPPVARTQTLQVLPGQWPAADAPGLLSGVTVNPASAHPNSIPEDWTFFAGPSATPGKRARIINIEASSARRVRITARDEYEAYYPLEWGLGGAPEPVSGEGLVARAFNLSAWPAPTGGTRLAWELEAAHGAYVMVSVNNASAAQVPIQGYLTISGTELLMPAYAPGTHLRVQVLPVASGVPVKVEGDVLELTI